MEVIRIGMQPVCFHITGELSEVILISSLRDEELATINLLAYKLPFGDLMC